MTVGAHEHPGGPVVLVGLMATGKSTVGRALARRFDGRLFDSDAMIEARTGRTVAQIFATDGEAAFRALETEALEDALTSAAEDADAGRRSVVAAAGGVILSPENRARLREASAGGAVIVWLRADPEFLARRVRPGDHRPLLATDPIGTLKQMAEQREALYRQVADAVVDVDRHPIGQVANLVAEAASAAAVR